MKTDISKLVMCGNADTGDLLPEVHLINAKNGALGRIDFGKKIFL